MVGPWISIPAFSHKLGDTSLQLIARVIPTSSGSCPGMNFAATAPAGKPQAVASRMSARPGHDRWKAIDTHTRAEHPLGTLLPFKSYGLG